MYPTLFPPLDSQDSATRNTVNLNTLLLFQTKEKSILLANFKAGKVYKHLFTPCGLVWSTFTRALLWEVAKPYWPVLYHSLMWKKWSRSVVSNSLRPHGLWPTRLLCPWDFPGKSTGVDCHFLLQVIFPTNGSNPGLHHYGQTLYCLSHQGSPGIIV